MGIMNLIKKAQDKFDKYQDNKIERAKKRIVSMEELIKIEKTKAELDKVKAIRAEEKRKRFGF